MFFKNKCENYVSCEDCKCLIDIDVCQKIKVYIQYGYITEFYCGRCEKPYTRVERSYSSSNSPHLYFKEIEVDENGEPVGYKKISK